MENVNLLPQTILFYDGLCNFCDGTVQFVLRHDHSRKFRFCSLQSTEAEQILKDHNFGPIELDTIVLLHRGCIFTKSTAILTTLKIIGGSFSIGYGFIVIPKPIRDLAYDFISRNRYRLFGKKEACRIPTPAQRSQFMTF